MTPRSIPKPVVGFSGGSGSGVVVRTTRWTSTRTASRTTRISLTLPPAANSAARRSSLWGANLMAPSPLTCRGGTDVNNRRGQRSLLLRDWARRVRQPRVTLRQCRACSPAVTMSGVFPFGNTPLDVPEREHQARLAWMSTPPGQQPVSRRYRHLNHPREVGTALGALRRSLGMTQGQLAERAAVTRKWISQMENGKATAQVGVLCRVLGALDARLEIVHMPSQRPPLRDLVFGPLEEPAP